MKRDLLKKRREFQSRIGTRANFGVEWEPDSWSIRRGEGDGAGVGGEGEQSAVLGRSGGQSFAGGGHEDRGGRSEDGALDLVGRKGGRGERRRVTFFPGPRKQAGARSGARARSLRP